MDLLFWIEVGLYSIALVMFIIHRSKLGWIFAATGGILVLGTILVDSWGKDWPVFTVVALILMVPVLFVLLPKLKTDTEV